LKEQLLATLERLQHECRSRSTALASAAHDLKAPVAIILGFANLLKKGRLGPINDRQLQAIDEIVGSCMQLDHDISDLMVYGSSGAGRLKASLQPGDLNVCAEKLQDRWSRLFAEKRIGFRINLEEAPIHFSFDCHKVQQAIANLLENALKFTPCGGEVSVSVSRHFWERRGTFQQVRVDRRLSRSNDPNAAKIIVADNGPGIDPEYHQDIFEEFFSMSPGEHASAGLGLAITRKIVHAHGGKIWVESSIGTGARFCMLLPFAPPAGLNREVKQNVNAESSIEQLGARG
jgi:signal transduction histidine kinase